MKNLMIAALILLTVVFAGCGTNKRVMEFSAPCSRCETKAWEECSVCSGGIQTCPSCVPGGAHGCSLCEEGKITCAHCGGTNRVPCNNCEGKGHTYWND